MIKLRYSSIFILLSLAVVLAYFIVKYQNQQTKLSQITINNKIINVEIADTDAKREKGLSFHKPLTDDEGMLFVFENSGFYGFWMKNMQFDLNFIWINNGRVVDITENVSHNNQERIYQSKVMVDEVLEVNAGFVKLNRIRIGDNVISQ